MGGQVVMTSTKTGKGINELVAAVTKAIQATGVRIVEREKYWEEEEEEEEVDAAEAEQERLEHLKKR
jgi:Fe2+ transport system protein B